MLADVQSSYGLARPFQGAGNFETEHQRVIVREVCAAVQTGRLIVVSGLVGSGKTHLLRRIEDELARAGKVAVAKSLAAYMAVSQSLTAVDTRSNGIDGEGAKQLAAAVLGSSSVAAFGDVPIKELRADALRTLDLSDNNLGLTEAHVLAGLLPISHSLTQVLAIRKCWSR